MKELTLSIPDDVQQQLQKRADEQGREFAAIALEILELGLRYAPSTPQAASLTHEERLKALQEWVQSRPKIDVILDDSRESIYKGCGE